MSMISAQIDELHKWADQLSERENEFGVVVRALVAALRDAADTIWQLRDDLQRANAAVQDAERLFRANVEKNGEILRLVGENAKLRELLRAAYNCTNAGPSCLECRIVAGGCTLLSAMRELGVDVP